MMTSYLPTILRRAYETLSDIGGATERDACIAAAIEIEQLERQIQRLLVRQYAADDLVDAVNTYDDEAHPEASFDKVLTAAALYVEARMSGLCEVNE